MKLFVLTTALLAVVLAIGGVLYVKRERLTPPEIERLTRSFSQQELRYFSKVAFGAHATVLGRRVIHRWAKPVVRFKVMTAATEEEAQEVQKVLADLNGIVRPTRFQLVTGEADVEIYFVPKREVDKKVSGSRGFNNGVFGYRTNWQGEIEHARVAVANDLSLPGWERAIIREEITQSLGLPEDTDWYPKSVFSSDRRIIIDDVTANTADYFTTEFAAIDKQLVRLLYNTQLPCNLTEQEFNDKVLQQ